MLVKDELQRFLDEEMKNFDINNKRLILYYYGFQDGNIHTGEEAYDKYKSVKGLDSAKEAGNKRSGPSGVISPFKKKIKKSSLESLLNCANILQQYEFIRSQEYFQLLCNVKLVESGFANARGILNLLHEVGACLDVEMYGQDLKDLTKALGKTLDKYQNAFLIKKYLLQKISMGLEYAEGLPGEIGLVLR